MRVVSFLEPTYGRENRIYGETLAVREDADYAVEIPVDRVMAETALDQGRRFVGRMRKYWAEEGFL